MQKSNAPIKLTVAFASGSGAGPVNTIPLTTNPTTGGASYQTGFTSVNMEPIASGGVPPYGADVNGLFQNQTKAQIWQQAGYMYPFDATFAGNANIGGYPAGSVLMMGSGKGVWLNQSDNNTTSPDTTGSVGWLGMAAAGTSTITTTGGTTTPDPSVLGVTTLIVTGALTSNATLVLPLTGGARWIVVNNTTGSYTLTVQGSSGSGVSITSGAPIAVFTDGTNYYGVSANLSGAYLPINGTAVAATKLATARTIAMTGDVNWTSPAFDGTANVTAAGTIVAGAVSLAKMANFQANSLMGNPTGSAAAPSAITLQNGLIFSGSNLGLGDIVPSSVSTAGTISGVGIITTGGFIVSNAGSPASYPVQGTVFRWNFTSGRGETDFITSHGSGAGGFDWYDGPGGSTTPSLLMSLQPAGSAIPGLSVNRVVTTGISPNITNGIATFGLYASGSYGGGVGLLDGSFAWGIYDVSGTLIFGSGTGVAGALTQRMSLTNTGNLTTYGTSVNFNASDRDIKTNFVEREALPSHRLWFGDYDRIDTEEHGIGRRAQDVLATHPHRVHEDPSMRVMDSITGQERPMLLIDRVGLCEEQGIWCGRQIDRIEAALATAGIPVN